MTTKQPDLIAKLLGDEFGGVESPIEALFLAAFYIRLAQRGGLFCAYFEIDSQYEVCSAAYRVDFIISVSIKAVEASVIIECDGRDYHHASWAQIERDRQRDIAIEAELGIKVLRFPGTQIFNDPAGCADIVIDHLEAVFMPRWRGAAA